MRNINWIIVIHNPMGVISKNFNGTVEQATDFVEIQSIETERTVTAHSEETDVIIDSRRINQ